MPKVNGRSGAPGAQNNVENVIRVRANYGKKVVLLDTLRSPLRSPLTLGISCNAGASTSTALCSFYVFREWRARIVDESEDDRRFRDVRDEQRYGAEEQKLRRRMA
jgi:hypothetical protein